MIKNKNGITNRKVQKYMEQARKELKDEKLLTDNTFSNLAKIIGRTYLNLSCELIALKIARSFTKNIKDNLKLK